MSALSTLENWLAPILNPFRDIPKHLGNIEQNHNTSLTTFNTLMTGLVTAPPAQGFSGPAAEEAVQIAEEYLRTASTLTSTESALAEVGAATTTCVAEAETATETLAAAAEDESVLIEVTEAVDAADVLQGGADVITDVIGIVLTVIVAAVMLKALIDFGTALYHAYQKWQQAMHKASGQSKPNFPKGPQNSLTTEQEQMAQRLAKETGIDIDLIRELIAENPNLTEDQLRQLLSQYHKVIAQHPNLVKKYGATRVFLAFVALAAYDKAKGGNWDDTDPKKRKPVKGSLYKGIAEAEAMLGVVENGDAPWINPSTHEGADGIDNTGQEWDVKAPRSGMRPPFDLAKTVKGIEEELREKVNVIVDTRNMSDADFQALYDELKKRGELDRVRWFNGYPGDPTYGRPTS